MFIKRADTFNTQTIAEALYYFAKNRIGEKALIDTMIRRLDNDSQKDKNLESIHPRIVVEVILSLNLAGADKAIIARYTRGLKAKLQQLTPEELTILNQSLPTDSEYDSIRTGINEQLAK